MPKPLLLLDRSVVAPKLVKEEVVAVELEGLTVGAASNLNIAAPLLAGSFPNAMLPPDRTPNANGFGASAVGTEEEPKEKRGVWGVRAVIPPALLLLLMMLVAVLPPNCKGSACVENPPLKAVGLKADIVSLTLRCAFRLEG